MYDTELGDAMRSVNQFYYSFSPAVSDWERQNYIFKNAVLLLITPSMESFAFLDHNKFESDQSLITYVLGIIFLNIGMYVGIPASVIIGIRKKF